jgi:hypothetical protein
MYQKVKGCFFEKGTVYVKMEHNISHLPLSLTVGVHPPWSLLTDSISAVILAGVTPHQQLTQAR